jgi:hypothetical protein
VQVCRIKWRRSDVSKAEINGMDLFFVDSTAVTLEAGDVGFAQVAGELRAQGVEVAVEDGTSE